MQLFINDQLVDLADDSAIALTFQINNLGEVKNQQGNTSNQFKLPLTQRNRRILGFPDDVALNAGALYSRYNAKLVQDGLEIIPYGVAELNSVENDTVNVTILSGNVDFFDALGGKIYEMGDNTSQWSKYGKQMFWQTHDHEWNLHSVISSQQNTEGWIYPVIDYGKLSYNPAGGKHEINVRQLRPGFFVKTAVNILVSSTGYRASGSLTKDPLYDKLICQFSNSKWEHGTDYQNQPDNLSVAVSLASDFSRQHPDVRNNKGTVTFNRVDADKGRQFKNYNTFVANETMKVKVAFVIPEFVFQGVYNTKHRPTFKFILRVNRGGTEQIIQELGFDLNADITIVQVGSFRFQARRIFKNKDITTELSLNKGDSIRMDYEFFDDVPSEFNLKQGASFTIKPINQDVQYGQTVQCERILPDLSQKDFLKDVLQRFGVICQTNAVERTIVFSSLRDIVKNIPKAKDWTQKCLDQGKQIAYQLGNYAQVNYMLFEEDDAIPLKFGQAQIDVQDASLPATAELFKSPFAPSLNSPYIGGPVTQIKMMEQESDNDDFSIDVAPRLLINETRFISDATPIEFTDGINRVIVKNDYISTPYFYKEGAEDHLCYSDMGDTNIKQPGTKTRYYGELEKVLQQTKKVVRYFMLSPCDVLELDLLIPVYLQQDSAYYYINKIDNWRKGQPVKVELIRL